MLPLGFEVKYFSTGVKWTLFKEEQKKTVSTFEIPAPMADTPRKIHLTSRMVITSFPARLWDGY